MTGPFPSKALSVRQPWAWAIVYGGKDVENRSTFAVSKGDLKPARIAVHASKGMTRDEYECARETMAKLNVECPRPDALVRGAIIGSVIVEAVVKESDSPWFFGPRGLVLSGAVPVPPLPALGALGYFQWKIAGDVEAPLPWMLAWPGKTVRTVQQEPMPLFGAAS